MPRGKGIYDDEGVDKPTHDGGSSGRDDDNGAEQESTPDVADTRGEPTA